MKTIEKKELIEKWVEAIKLGRYGNSKDIVDTYNYIFQGIKPTQKQTTCGSCLRRCITEMNAQLQRDLKQIEEENKQKEELTKNNKNKKLKKHENEEN